MVTTPISDIVSQQYSKWMYPAPILDVSLWSKNNWQWFDPSHAHRVFWPARDYQPDMDILVAGCGTNQAAIIAFNNPKANVVAIDISQPSLNHHAFLKDKYGLENLDLRLMLIEDVAMLGQSFDLIISTGVLHHLVSPERGMAALASCLRPDGVAAIMLYARFGRLGVEMMQSVFRELGLKQDENSLDMVRAALQVLPSNHPLQGYLELAPDLENDAGLVDTFLHYRERSYDVAECEELVTSAGLVMQDFFRKASYYPPQGQRGAFFDEVARLPDRQQWAIMERINHRNACHFFLACHPNRAEQSYRINFAGNDHLNYIPHFRYRCGFKSPEIFKPDWRQPLGPAACAAIKLVNGVRTISQITQEASRKIKMVPAAGDPVDFVRKLFQALWRTDYITFKIPEAAPGQRKRPSTRLKKA